MNKDERSGVTEKPGEPHVLNTRLNAGVISFTRRDELKNIIPRETHHGAGGRVQTRGVIKIIDYYAKQERRSQKKQLWCFEGKKNDGERIRQQNDIWTQLYVLHDQNLKQDEKNKPKNIFCYLSRQFVSARPFRGSRALL
ncbi:MAG: hypothetical protein K0S12_8 [Bacteroidetes bacterium]|nr:hypothetical protein [Bacteroidota bacterium]